jgi:hypothetical protein
MILLRKNPIRLFRLLVCFLGIVAALPATAGFFSKSYSAEPIEAWVIDAETKQPLEGVIVTANWQLEEGTFGGNVPVGQLMVMEAVTDKDGKFTFPAWGPIKPTKGHLVIRDPQLLLFKSGYKHVGLENEFTQNYNKGSVRHSEWNGKKIEMERFKGTLEEYGKHLGFMETSLETIINEDCNWKRIPRMMLAVSQQSGIFRDKGLYALPSVDSIDIKFRNRVARCGSPKEFFRNYKP